MQWPLAGYDTPSGKAFTCTGLGEHRGDLIAVVCDPNVPIRMEQITALGGFSGPGLVKCIDSGVVKLGSFCSTSAGFNF